MNIRQLIKGLPLQIKGDSKVTVTGLSRDSRTVAPGNLFFAEEEKHIAQAVENGAGAVVTDLYNPFLSVTQIICAKPKELESILSNRFFHFPSSKLHLTGITGTNGKTTCSFLLKHILQEAGLDTGLIGTIGYFIGEKKYEPGLTTPDLLTNQKLLQEMLSYGQKHAVMEVSSHAIDQERVRGLQFQSAIYTNLTHEHLDYHESMSHYAFTKKKLFLSLPSSAFAVMNIDCPYFSFMQDQVKAKIITYGLKNSADFQGKILSQNINGSSFSVTVEKEEFSFSTPLIGLFNIYNLLSVIAFARKIGVPMQQIQRSIKTFSGVSGRMEKIVVSSNPTVIVDFAHSEDALQNILDTLRPLCKKRLITVFGCGGNRDYAKRPKMAKIAEEYSDLTIVTSDNPREENPNTIIQQIIKGFTGKNYVIEPDRKKAITKAIQSSDKDDLIVIAGKGHEKTQITAHQTIDFDDVEVAKEVLQKGPAYV